MRWGRSGVLALAVFTLLGPAVPAAIASDDPRAKKHRVDVKVKALRVQVKDAAAQVAAATTALDAADAKLPGARAALQRAQDGLVAARAAATDAADRLQAAQVEAVRTARTYDRVAEDLVGHRSAAGALARQAYMGGDLARLSLALGARSPEELTSALAYAQSVSRSERGMLEVLGSEQRSLGMQQAQLEALRERVTLEQRAADEAVTRSGRAELTAADANTAVERLIAARAEALGEAEKLKKEVEAEFAAEEAESARLAKIIAERSAAARHNHRGIGPIPLGDGILGFPVIAPVTSPFGMRYHPILHRWKLHTGTDFGVPIGTPVHAAMDGVVLETLHNSAYGNRVIVDHGLVNGVYVVTTYNHLSRWTVHRGQTVHRGELLAYSGNTGWTTGPHLHFEVLLDGRFVNPMTWLSSRLRRAS